MEDILNMPAWQIMGIGEIGEIVETMLSILNTKFNSDWDLRGFDFENSAHLLSGTIATIVNPESHKLSKFYFDDSSVSVEGELKVYAQDIVEAYEETMCDIYPDYKKAYEENARKKKIEEAQPEMASKKAAKPATIRVKFFSSYQPEKQVQSEKLAFDIDGETIKEIVKKRLALSPENYHFDTDKIKIIGDNIQSRTGIKVIVNKGFNHPDQGKYETTLTLRTLYCSFVSVSGYDNRYDRELTRIVVETLSQKYPQYPEYYAKAVTKFYSDRYTQQKSSLENAVYQFEEALKFIGKTAGDAAEAILSGEQALNFAKLDSIQDEIQ